MSLIRWTDLTPPMLSGVCLGMPIVADTTGRSVEETCRITEAGVEARLRSAGWVPMSEATPVNAERQAVRFAAVDLPAEVNHDRAQIEALGRRLTEEESLTALGLAMVGEGEHPLIKPAK